MVKADPRIEGHVKQLKSLGHAIRLSIVRIVVQGPVEGMPVGEIQARLGIPGSTLSHHLAELTRAGMLRSTRLGTTIRYAADFEALRDLTNYLWKGCCGSGERSPFCL